MTENLDAADCLADRTLIVQRYHWTRHSSGGSQVSFQLGMPTLIEYAGVSENLDLCQKLGLSFVELNMNLPCCGPDSLRPESLRTMQAETGVGFTLHLPEELDLACIHGPLRVGHIQTAVSAMEWAGQSGIGLAVMHLCEGIYFTLPDRKEYIYAQRESGFCERLLDGFGTVLKAANDAGVQLCLENTADWTVPHLAEGMGMLLRHFSELGLCWDVGHDESCGRVNRPFFEANRNRIRHMHLHDARGLANHQPLLTGSVDVGERLELAESLEIGVVLEVKTADSLSESVQNLRRHDLVA